MLKKIQRGFTLLELLIVITILAILTLVVVLFINPVEMLKKSRDVQRMSDLATLNAAIVLFLQDKTGAGVFLALWGALLVSAVDNFIKPILIGSKTKLPMVLIFFGVLGSLQVYGFLGVLLGPMLMACVLAFVRIYREEFT